MKGNGRTDVGLLILRLALGLTLLYFGSQKMLGLFGGQGYSATVAGFTKMGIPVVLAHIGIFGEFCGSLGVLFGLLTPIAAFGAACTMGVATFMNSKAPDALSNAFAAGKGGDKLFFPASLCLVAIVILIIGPGAHSLDSKFFRKNKR